MDNQLPEPDVARGPRGSQALFGVLGFLLGVMLTLLLAAALIWVYSSTGLLGLLKARMGSGGEQVNIAQPTVVRQLQQLERFETIVYALEKIVSNEHEGRYLPKFLTGDRLLLIVHGEVIAGVDLSQLRSEDVVVRGRVIQLKLPKAQVFATRIDNERTRVYSRTTGLLRRMDPDLETEARREAERQLREAALQDGILRAAEQNARATLTGLLKGFGFEQAKLH